MFLLEGPLSLSLFFFFFFLFGKSQFLAPFYSSSVVSLVHWQMVNMDCWVSCVASARFIGFVWNWRHLRWFFRCLFSL
jgi:hypothetical protein